MYQKGNAYWGFSLFLSFFSNFTIKFQTGPKLFWMVASRAAALRERRSCGTGNFSSCESLRDIFLMTHSCADGVIREPNSICLNPFLFFYKCTFLSRGAIHHEEPHMDLLYLCLWEQRQQVGCGRCAAGRHIISGAEFKHRHVNIRQIVETHQRECFLNLLESFHISL